MYGREAGSERCLHGKSSEQAVLVSGRVSRQPHLHESVPRSGSAYTERARGSRAGDAKTPPGSTRRELGRDGKR